MDSCTGSRGELPTIIRVDEVALDGVVVVGAARRGRARHHCSHVLTEAKNCCPRVGPWRFSLCKDVENRDAVR